MALTNFMLTVVGVGAVVLMLKGDVRKTYPVLRRNLRQVREWLEQEQGTAASRFVVSPSRLAELPSSFLLIKESGRLRP